MHKLILVAAAAALAGCSQEQPAAEAVNDADVAMEANAADANVAAEPAAFTLNSTTWTYTADDGKPEQTTIDANGNFVTTSGAEHRDHGTMKMVDGKACFTSAMNQDGPECWTVQETAVGGSFESSSDKGNKLTVTRVAYVAAPPM